jgi:hypothetical protein
VVSLLKVLKPYSSDEMEFKAAQIVIVAEPFMVKGILVHHFAFQLISLDNHNPES